MPPSSGRSENLKTEAAWSYGMFVSYSITTRRHNSEDFDLNSDESSFS